MNNKLFNISHPTITTLHTIIMIAVWSLMIGAPLLLNSINGYDYQPSLHMFIDYIIIFIFLIINRLLIHWFFPKKRYKTYFFFVLIGMLFTIASIYTYEISSQGRPFEAPQEMGFTPNMGENGRPMDGPDPFMGGNGRPMDGPNPHMSEIRPGKFIVIPRVIDLSLLAFLLIGLDTLLFISLRWMKAEQERNKLAKDNMQMQLYFLQQQVSPHLFMNTLNNIHALIDIDPEKAQNALLQLSQLMSYLIYDSHKTMIKLTDELNFIDNYIELMRLRFPKRVLINWNRPHDFSPTINVPPLLYISAIENAFKYGVSYKKESYIYIDLALIPNNDTPKNLQLTIRNSDYSQQVNRVDPEKKSKIDRKNGHSGLGLTNMKDRLDMLYPDKYKLNYENKEGEYQFALTIPLIKQDCKNEKDNLHSHR